MTRTSLVACAFLVACSTPPDAPTAATPPPAEAPPAGAPTSQPSSQPTSRPGHGRHGKHGGHGMHAGHGKGHGRGHGKHGGLKHVMHQMALSLMSLQSALEEGRAEDAAAQASRIAKACEGHDPSHHEGEDLGPRFVELDKTLHDSSAKLAELARAGDLKAASAKYGDVTAACTACHTQAPRAKSVRLGHLIDAIRSE